MITTILTQNNFNTKYYLKLKNKHYMVIGNKGRFDNNQIHTYIIKVSDTNTIVYESLLTHTSFTSYSKAKTFINDVNIICMLMKNI